ncbi:MAG TPA: YidB family protein [Stellaceae bacterium]|nr:YidB family protein [Stellaceae bacterium]
MSLLDSISGALKSALAGGDASGMPGLINTALGKTELGNMQGIVAKLEQAGCGQQIQSWLGGGANLPITAEQLRIALGDEHVQALATHFGLPVDAAMKLLAEHLPTAVDQASPGGTLPS